MQAEGDRNLLVPSATNRGLGLVSRAALLVISSMLFTHPASAQNPPAPAKCPPAARVDSAKDTYGSIVVADPYRWLEDQNSPETRAWIDAEQKCTEAALQFAWSRRLGQAPDDSSSYHDVSVAARTWRPLFLPKAPCGSGPGSHLPSPLQGRRR